MKFNVDKVYTSVNADKVKIGSKGYFSDALKYLKDAVEQEQGEKYGEIAEIKDETYESRFKIKDDYFYGLFYLVEDPKKTEYRPYNDVSEMIDHFCSHFNLVSSTHSLPHIWVKGKPESKYKDEITQAVGFYKNNVSIGLPCNAKDKFTLYTLHELFDYFTYLDGTPCGIKE